jgi:sigma-54 specific flagellar transcriptional regulator A
MPEPEPEAESEPEPDDFDLPDIEGIVRRAQGLPSLPDQGLDLKDHIAGIERDIIAQALERTAYNVSQTARLLSVRRTTLIEKINKYELSSNA